MRRHLSYANVTATIALFLALGTGAVFAAGEIGSREIANNSVRTQDLKDRRGVKGEDARRNTFGAREVEEGDLVGGRITMLDGTQSASCDPPPGTFIDCSVVALDLRSQSTLLVTGTGGFSASADNASAECELRLDGVDEPVSAAPGVVANNTSISGTDGFARTTLEEGVSAGQHSVALACQQIGTPDAQIRTPTISVIAVSSE